ncbi:bifunctional 4-hydroxy-2-oxoglutarate aldolase/2-dehydro-3-deoxy-phosphogluconate aldolase [Butyrivibrio sp. JL13D10]|uniref:bifunctional 4-hydroxy-2-oxoglutarate aldolase/2-dehydro-3-deoxy-phosphogluconate aldolase n=1 Tax=Butyrivibrio sp. JL13D10 TaxID=3236815 RepID=UPI0038B4617A
MYEEMKEKLKKIGIIPVVVLENAGDAAQLGKALMEGGLPAAEVTFRTEAAEESLRILSKELPDMLLGAGTVLTTEQADRAVEAGAKFIVAPGFNPTVVKHCLAKGYPIVPGVQTPSEMEQAMELGLDFVKFFPAEAAGGLNMIKAVAAPYTKLVFMPTGGINEQNVKDYLGFKKIVACGGTWMVKNSLIESGDFEKIKELTKNAAKIVKEVRGDL